jgi:hypothetical protein
MFDLSFFNIELFSFVLFAALPVLFGDSGDWLSDIVGWFKDAYSFILAYFKTLFEWLVKQIQGFIKSVLEIVEYVAWAFNNLFQNFWEGLRNFFSLVLEFFSNIWYWIFEVIERSYEFFEMLFESLWDAVVGAVELYCQWFQDLLSYIGSSLWEILLQLGDGLVGMCVDMLLWMFDMLFSDFQMPTGFEQGVTYLIKFGMLLNEILPIREAFSLFAIYVMIRIVVGVNRYIRRLPFRFITG